jgi:hypothetical protein
MQRPLISIIACRLVKRGSFGQECLEWCLILDGVFQVGIMMCWRDFAAKDIWCSFDGIYTCSVKNVIQCFLMIVINDCEASSRNSIGWSNTDAININALGCLPMKSLAKGLQEGLGKPRYSVKILGEVHLQCNLLDFPEAAWNCQQYLSLMARRSFAESR